MVNTFTERGARGVLNNLPWIKRLQLEDENTCSVVSAALAAASGTTCSASLTGWEETVLRACYRITHLLYLSLNVPSVTHGGKAYACNNITVGMRIWYFGIELRNGRVKSLNVPLC
jgi:hypothetical protein